MLFNIVLSPSPVSVAVVLVNFSLFVFPIYLFGFNIGNVDRNSFHARDFFSFFSADGHACLNRVLLHSLLHKDALHLCGNIVSVVHTSYQLERFMGSDKLIRLLTLSLLICPIIYAMLAACLDMGFDEPITGMSGVLFSLKYVCNTFGLSPFLLTWLELLTFHFVSPHTYLLHHVAGTLSGIVYVYCFSPWEEYMMPSSIPIVATEKEESFVSEPEDSAVGYFSNRTAASVSADNTSFPDDVASSASALAFEPAVDIRELRLRKLERTNERTSWSSLSKPKR